MMQTKSKTILNLKVLVRKGKKKKFKHGLLGDLPNCMHL